MKKALVMGLGKSGLASSKFLIKKGFAVTAIDTQSIPTDLPIQFHLEKNYSPETHFEFAVISPGVSPQHRIIVELKRKNIPIFGEVSLAAQFIRQPMIGITGTNGKTSVTSMVTHVLNQCGVLARAVGNIGIPLIQYALQQTEEILVVELSSFQLETLQMKCLDLGILLNITPDHLDRYAGFLAYAKTKLEMQNCLKDKATMYISRNSKKRFGSFLKHKNFPEFDIDTEMKVAGFVPSNLAAAFAICSHFSITKANFIDCLLFFKPHKHRLEFVRELNQIHFYNDSKATNMDAVRMAVEALGGKIWLLSGGISKGHSFTSWSWQLKAQVQGIYAFGSCAHQIALEVSNSIQVVLTATLREAVLQAYFGAKPGDIVLLSPGCSSFDQFQNYEHRGDVFKKIVEELV